MSDPAYYFVGDKTYYSRNGARYIEEWLFWGPQVLEPYLRVLGPPMDSDLNDVAFGGFTLFPEERRLLWFGGDSNNYCPFHRQLYLRLMRAVWTSEWRIEWAGRGLQTLAKAAQRSLPLEDAHPAFSEHQGVYRKQFGFLSKETGEEFGTTGAVSIRYLNDEIALFPIHDGDVSESYLWAGPDEIMDALSQRLPRQVVEFPSGHKNPVGIYGGFHLDFKKKVLGYWSLGPVVEPVCREAWPDWTIIDWEERFEEHVKITEGRLQPVYPPLEDLLIQMERSLVAEVPSDDKAFYQTHEIDDENWNVVEEIAFPVSLDERRLIWNKALQKTGLASKPYPKDWWSNI